MRSTFLLAVWLAATVPVNAQLFPRLPQRGRISHEPESEPPADLPGISENPDGEGGHTNSGPPPDYLKPDSEGESGAGSVPTDEEEYAPAPEPNACLEDDESCDELEDVAEEVLSDLVSLASLAISLAISSSSSAPPSISLPASVSVPATASTTPTPFPIPNYNVAAGVELNQDFVALLDSAEQSMYFTDPLCFFANVERQYANAAGKAASTASSNVSLSVARRQLGPLTNTGLPTFTDYYATFQQVSLFKSYLPSQLLRIYSPVPSSGSVMFTTSTTTCAGLDGAPSFQTPFAVQVVTPSSAAPAPPPTSSGAATSSASGAQRRATPGVIALGAAGVVGLLAF